MKTPKSYPLTLLFLLASACLYSSNVSLQEAKVLSSESGKNIFVNYSASWCLPCQIFKEHTLSDPRIDNILETDFVVVDADWDNDIYKQVYENYEVCCLPTLHVLDSNGKILDEVSSNLSADLLYLRLLKYGKEKSKSTQIRNAPAQYVSNGITQQLYTVQAGAFSSLENATNQKARIEKYVSDQVYIVRDDNRRLYFVQVGDYGTSNNLKPLVQLLSKSRIDSFLKRKE